MKPTDKTGKKLYAWRKRTNKDMQVSSRPISDAAKAAFRRAAYQTERKGENDDCNQNDTQTDA